MVALLYIGLFPLGPAALLGALFSTSNLTSLQSLGPGTSQMTASVSSSCADGVLSFTDRRILLGTTNREIGNIWG